MIAILGAGLAGLSAAYELIEKGAPGKEILILEKEEEVGGLAQTKSYNGFRFDLGPHRWFTKSAEVDRMWEKVNSPDIFELERLTRIWYKKKLFNYPLSPFNALKNLGPVESSAAILSYGMQMIKNKFPDNLPKNMEEAFIRQFGTVLYDAFFKEYNQKLWGGHGCRDLSPDWVKQRVKNLSLGQVLLDAVGLGKKGKVISLVDRFKYPTHGTGQLSENLARAIKEAGGAIQCAAEVRRIVREGGRLSHVIVRHNGHDEEYAIDYCISSIPINLFANALHPVLSGDIIRVSDGLKYRDMVFIVLFVDVSRTMRDNWLYVQDPSVSFNRFMDMGSWNQSLSPQGTTSLIFEVTCEFGDDKWNLPDSEWIARITEEYIREFGFVNKKQIIGGAVFRKTHAYPVYSLDYKERLTHLKSALREIENLQIIGRNGLFRYNNMDHSMATGIGAARNYLGASIEMDTINIDEEYHEEIKAT